MAQGLGPPARAARRDELQQQAGGVGPRLTTHQRIAVADNLNAVKSAPRGPTLPEDVAPPREKITRFDHERWGRGPKWCTLA